MQLVLNILIGMLFVVAYFHCHRRLAIYGKSQRERSIFFAYVAGIATLTLVLRFVGGNAEEIGYRFWFVMLFIFWLHYAYKALQEKG